MMTKHKSAPGCRLWAPEYPHAPRRWPFFYGWVLVALSSAGLLASMPGQTMGFSVFIDILIEELGLTRDQISLAYLAGTLISGLLIPWGGVLLDRVGARKTMVISSAGLGFVCLYFSFIDHVLRVFSGALPVMAPVVAAWLVVGVGFFVIRFMGQGMMAMTAAAMLGKWFFHRRGIVQSLRGLINAIGFAVTPLVLAWLLFQFGWRASYWILALFCGFGMAAAAWWFYRDNPEECGLRMDGDYEPPGGKLRTPDLLIVRDFTRAEALRTYSFWVFCLIFSVFSLLGTGFTFHILSIGASVGMAPTEILAIFIPITLISIPTNLVMGWLSDRIRIRYLFSAMAFGLFLGGISIHWMPELPGVALYAVGMGVAGAGFSALSGIIWPRYFGRTHLGAISGIFMSTTVIFSALGPFMFSRAFTVWGTYTPAFAACAVMAAVLFACSLFAENPQRKLSADSSASGV